MTSRRKKTKIAVKRVIGICLIIIILSGLCALAANTKLNRVKIICSNNYEITTMTSKTKVSEILEDNHIIVLPEEKVEPDLNKQISSGDTIKISSKTEEEKVAEVAQTTTNISEEEIKKAYVAITEKFVIEQEKIAFETITKDVSNSSEEKTDSVLQEGVEGIKEVTYKVKCQNDIEIEKIKVSENIIQEPINKIIQIKAKATSRAVTKSRKEAVSNKETTSTTTTKAPTKAPQTSSKSGLAAKVDGKTPTIKTMNTSAYTASTCGKDSTSSGYGVTSSGAKASSWYTVAAGKAYPVGTIIYIPYFQNKPNGGWFVVQDRGSSISNNRIDIYMGTYNECINFGRKNLECYIYN